MGNTEGFVILGLLLIGGLIWAIICRPSATGDVEAKYRAEDDVPLAPEDNEYSAEYKP